VTEPVPPPVTRILLADDHVLVRAGLASLIDSTGDLTVVAQAGNGVEAVDRAREVRPHVVLMDLSMPAMDGVAATGAITSELPGTAVVVLTSFSDQARVREALAAGALGYLLKDGEPRDLLAGVRAAARGDSPLDPRVAGTLLPRAAEPAAGSSPVGLSAREKEVLLLVCKGMANKQIARTLSITEHTVKVHIGNAFRRIGVRDRTSAAVWALEHLLPPEP
jgi:DNA-binding NarL/FixJ family response regulator